MICIQRLGSANCLYLVLTRFAFIIFYMISNTKKAFLYLSLLTTSLCFASDEGQRFYKCYALFTGERVPTNHPILTKVLTKQISGTDGCMELIRKATINESGMISTDPEAKKVLARVNELHNKWFFIKDPLSVSGIFVYSWPNTDLHDKYDPAFHLTYSMLKPGQQFKENVSRTYNLEAIRNSPKQPYAKEALENQDHCTFGNTSRTIFNQPEDNPFPMIGAPFGDWRLGLFQGSHLVSYYHPGYEAACKSDWGYKVWQPKIISRGELVGLKPVTYSNPVIDMSSVPYPDVSTNFGQAKYVNFNAFHGAGALGTQAYLIGNLGGYGNQDGGTHVRRRWSKNVLSDFLCRDLPALKSSDVSSEVFPDSEVSFRKGGSCMSCHMSMDPMAGVTRRLRGQGINGDNTYYGNYATFMKDHGPGTLPPADYPTIKPDEEFSNRNPAGRIMFRGYDDRLYDEQVEGLAELGNKFAEYDDLYVCGAKKYYNLLTGIDVRLPGPGGAPLNAAEKEHFKQVVKLGLELKKSQNVQQLLRSIIASPNFIRVEGN